MHTHLDLAPGKPDRDRACEGHLELLGSTRNASGQLVQRLVENATGRIVEKTLSAAGQAVAQKVVGSVLDLPTVSETAGAAGSVVRRVRDQAGKIIEFTLNKATNAVSNVKLP